MITFIRKVFDPATIVQLIVQAILIIVVVYVVLGDVRVTVAVHSERIDALRQTNLRLEEKIIEDKVRMDVRLDIINSKLDRIYQKLLEAGI